MMRWDIINHLIKQNNYKSYLEIGYYKGWSFDRVECEVKAAVDPNPCKDSDQQSYEYGSWICDKGEVYSYSPPITKCLHVIHKETSDEFFERIGDVKWDIIFIDGLHKSEQVDRDIQNALKHLNPGGTIVMHDCNPTTEEMTTTGTQAGEWTGDIYKSASKVLDAFGYNEFCVVDTDYGVGVLKPKGPKWNYDATVYDDPTWEEFSRDKGSHINSVSIEQFLIRETNETTTNYNGTT